MLFIKFIYVSVIGIVIITNIKYTVNGQINNEQPENQYKLLPEARQLAEVCPCLPKKLCPRIYGTSPDVGRHYNSNYSILLFQIIL